MDKNLIGRALRQLTVNDLTVAALCDDTQFQGVAIQQGCEVYFAVAHKGAICN